MQRQRSAPRDAWEGRLSPAAALPQGPPSPDDGWAQSSGAVPPLLRLDGASGLRLPANFALPSHLLVEHCSMPTALPVGFTVEYNLTLRDCPGLRTLPPDIRVGGNLLIEGCDDFEGLPADLSVGGNLVIRHCSRFHRLSSQRWAQGSIRIVDCAAFVGCHDDFSADACDLQFARCHRLMALPAGAFAARGVTVRSCLAFCRLPDDLQCLGNLYLERCDSLRGWKGDLLVGGNFGLQHCSALGALGGNLFVQGQVRVIDCPSLTYLADTVYCKKTLTIKNCGALQGWARCHSYVDYDIFLDNCPAIEGLPEAIMSWPWRPDNQPHALHYDGCRLSYHELLYMTRVIPPSITISVKEQGGRLETVPLGPLEREVLRWQEVLDGDLRRTCRHVPFTTLPPRGHLSAAQRQSLADYLAALHQSADFACPTRRPTWVRAVLHFLRQLWVDPNLRDACLEHLEANEGGCPDAAGLKFTSLYLLTQIAATQRSGSAAALRTLGTRVFALEEVRRVAARKVRALRQAQPDGLFEEEVEVYLAFEAFLADDLNLPTPLRRMLYREISQVSRADLRRARQAVDAAVRRPGAVEAFLADWEPWKVHLRRQAAAQLQWSDLPPVALSAEAQKGYCVISLQPFEGCDRPVAWLLPDQTSWAWAAMPDLLEWWWCNGNDPLLRAPLQLNQLARAVGSGSPRRTDLPSQSSAAGAPGAAGRPAPSGREIAEAA